MKRKYFDEALPSFFVFGEQFRCPSCGWESNFDPEFIAGYKYVWDLPGVDCEMLDEFRAILPLSLHFVMVDADMRYAGRIDDE